MSCLELKCARVFGSISEIGLRSSSFCNIIYCSAAVNRVIWIRVIDVSQSVTNTQQRIAINLGCRFYYDESWRYTLDGIVSAFHISRWIGVQLQRVAANWGVRRTIFKWFFPFIITLSFFSFAFRPTRHRLQRTASFAHLCIMPPIIITIPIQSTLNNIIIIFAATKFKYELNTWFCGKICCFHHMCMCIYNEYEQIFVWIDEKKIVILNLSFNSHLTNGQKTQPRYLNLHWYGDECVSFFLNNFFSFLISCWLSLYARSFI